MTSMTFSADMTLIHKIWQINEAEASALGKEVPLSQTICTLVQQGFAYRTLLAEEKQRKAEAEAKLRKKRKW